MSIYFDIFIATTELVKYLLSSQKCNGRILQQSRVQLLVPFAAFFDKPKFHQYIGNSRCSFYSFKKNKYCCIRYKFQVYRNKMVFMDDSFYYSQPDSASILVLVNYLKAPSGDYSLFPN